MAKSDRPHTSGRSATILRRIIPVVVLLIGLIVWLWLERSSAEERWSRIEEGLYVGGATPAPPPGTKAIVNLCKQEDQYSVEVCLWEPIDGSEPPSIDWVRRVVAFIDTQQRARKPNYVHCLAGMNRSGMVVTAYLMYKHDWTRDEALAFARSKRPLIQPNPTMLRVLAAWEKDLLSRE
jgi:hypothetical protein